MCPFTRRSHVPPDAETATRDAESSLQAARARTSEVEAKLTESRRVKEQLRAHNRANAYSDWIKDVVLGQRRGDG